MVKNARKAPMESSPPSSSFPVGEEARARYKHQSLMQDYEELLKETEAKKKKLQIAIQQKHKLLPEVKFLRRKFKSFSKNPSQVHRLKKQSHRIPSPSVRIARPQNPVPQSEYPSKDRSHRVKEAPTPRKSALLDLNQVSLPSFEEMQEFQSEWGPLATTAAEKLKACSADGEAFANDLKLSICRDVGSNSNRAGKRKISWQDPVTLRV